MGYWHRMTGIALVTWLGQSGMYPATPPDKPAGIDAIRAYEGTWDVSIEHFDTPHSKASRERTSLRNDCWKSGGYFACNQYVDGDSKVLLVFTYDEKSNVYTSYQVPLGGGNPGSGKLMIEGNVWTYPWQDGEGDKATYFRVVNVFIEAGKIEFRQEFSTDKIHWTLMGKGSETKVSATKVGAN
jgi:hypothetical protein